jgi:hypothetical protein
VSTSWVASVEGSRCRFLEVANREVASVEGSRCRFIEVANREVASVGVASVWVAIVGRMGSQC